MPKLCLGGAFNPIHHGHLLSARAAAEALGLTNIVVIPSGSPPHHKAEGLVSAAHRMEMCRRAIAGVPGFELDDRELSRAGSSFTIDTALELLREGWPEVHWFLGADQVMRLPTWHKPYELLRTVRFVIVARPGWVLDWERLPLEFRNLNASVIPAPLIDISATEIRRRVSEGKPIDFLTPPGVCRYIAEQGLYRTSRS
jgi:nicotinate-nucleotide adenylyltransferase